jgi:hypothetical protein
MAVQIADKYKGLRNRLTGLTFIIVFLSFILLKYVIPDYFVRENALKTDTAIIQNVFKNKYYSYERYRGKVYHPCIDIVLFDKPYFIRLSDGLDKQYWATINDTNNISRRIEVEFQSRLLHNNVLNNPNQVSIENKIIIPFNSKMKFMGWFAIIATIFDIVCIYLFYLSLNTYKINLYPYDKKVGQESKWKLFLLWLND